MKSVYLELLHPMFENKRLIVLIGWLSGIFAGLSFFSREFLFYFEQFIDFKITETSIPITFLLISVVSFSLIYLQSGGASNPEKESRDLYKRLYRETIINNKKLADTTEQLAFLKKKLETYESEKGLTDEEKQKIIDGAVIQTSEDTIKKIFSNETAKLEESIKQSLSLEQLRKSSQDIIDRLRREISDLRLRSNINLLIGMSITAGGLYLLWTTVDIIDTSKLLKELASEGTESNGKFLKNLFLPMVPRVLLVIFVEIFAYFFLRLYKDTLSEIKYFQNELTNVESKLVSIEFSFVTNQIDSLKFSLQALSGTERNFVLEKGQTTVELEKAKSNSELTRNIIKTIPSLFKQANK